MTELTPMQVRLILKMSEGRRKIIASVCKMRFQDKGFYDQLTPEQFEAKVRLASEEYRVLEDLETKMLQVDNQNAESNFITNH
jgi:hypothetical protein